MTRPIRRVAAIVHTGKSLGGGTDELRQLLTAKSIDKLDWYEVNKSAKAPTKVRKALRHDPDLVVIWGGDGMVQRCLDAMAESNVPVAIMPAGTANVLAHNLGIPHDLAEAVGVAFEGRRQRIDLGRVGREHFAVMAGVGFDADLIHEVDGGAKRRLGRLSYLWAGVREVGVRGTKATVKVDGTTWFDGKATCVLVGNVGQVMGGVQLFDGARPDDGWLDVGVATAQGGTQWARALAVIGTGRSDDSPFVRTTRARRISVRLDKPLRSEIDGGARDRVERLKIKVVPGAVTVCVPHDGRHVEARDG